MNAKTAFRGTRTGLNCVSVINFWNFYELVGDPSFGDPSESGGLLAQVVSGPVARSPGVFVEPAAHGTHALLRTRSFSSQEMAKHGVSGPEAASPASLRSPSSQGTHALLTT